jgi:hypothetical protein
MGSKKLAKSKIEDTREAKVISKKGHTMASYPGWVSPSDFYIPKMAGSGTAYQELENVFMTVAAHYWTSKNNEPNAIIMDRSEMFKFACHIDCTGITNDKVDKEEMEGLLKATKLFAQSGVIEYDKYSFLKARIDDLTKQYNDISSSRPSKRALQKEGIYNLQDFINHANKSFMKEIEAAQTQLEKLETNYATMTASCGCSS